MDIGYARVSTKQQDFERQLASLKEAGIEDRWIFEDKATGANTKRPGFEAARSHLREGDVLVVYTLDRLARNMRDTLNLIHELKEQGIGLRTLADPIPIDTASDNPMAELSVLMLALFAQMERVWNHERVAHARSKADRHPGRPKVLTPERVAAARRMQDGGESVRQIALTMGVSKSTLARALKGLDEQESGKAPGRPREAAPGRSA